MRSRIGLAATVREGFRQMTAQAKLTQLSYVIANLERMQAGSRKFSATQTMACSACHVLESAESSIQTAQGVTARVKERTARLRPLLTSDSALHVARVQKDFEEAHAILRDQMFSIVDEADKATALLTEE